MDVPGTPGCRRRLGARGWAIGHSQAALIVALIAALTACSTSGGSADGSATSNRPEASEYFVAGAPGWNTKEAYNPRPDDPITSRTEPTLDWYSEHERFPDPSRSQAVRVSGHDVPMAQLETHLAGFELRSRRVHDLQAKAGSGPDGPRVVLLPVAPGYTVMTLSYELTLEELIEWSNALKEVDEAGWIASGGIVVP